MQPGCLRPVYQNIFDRKDLKIMEKKMTIMGVGAKIAIPTLLWLAIAEAVSLITKPLFGITANYTVLLIVGIAMIAVGFSLNLVAAAAMLKATKEKKLATGGLYGVFRDPMYVLQIFITLPGLFLLFDSWLVLAGVIPAYLAYRYFVREEHKYLEGLYGEVYREYTKKVPIKL
jgi:protein-S-isoprenylcysteine O-methyltransferase Ste14